MGVCEGPNYFKRSDENRQGLESVNGLTADFNDISQKEKWKRVNFYRVDPDSFEFYDKK